MLSQVRSLLDEDNVSRVNDVDDILPALNRGQDYAAHLLAEHYDAPLITHATITTVANQKEYPIPEDAFEERLEQVEVFLNNIYYSLQYVPFQDISNYEYATLATRTPAYWTISGRNFKLVPMPSSAFSLRVWYNVDPFPLIKSQGRITNVNTSGNYILVDSVGSDLTTDTSQLNSYINIIDAQTGLRKATFQINQLPPGTTKIVLKTVPLRTTVQNLTIDTSLSALAINSAPDNDGPTNYSVNPDDLICVVQGTCVPVMAKPITNFIINYAVMEINRKLGLSNTSETEAFKELEEQVKDSWANRPNTMRIKLKSSGWGDPYFRRRYVNFTTTTN